MSMDEGTPTAAMTGPILALTGGERLLAGRYRVEQHIGRGGMAEVHVGTDTRLGRKVAIKLLKSSLANDPTFRMRFRQEAQAASRMTHPTIVRVFDAGEETVLESGGGEAQLPFIVMEYVDGKLLKDLIKDGPMSAQEAGHIIGGILTALEYSHRAGVVHRDIKPGNVMVTRAGQIKVMDFGIARAISDSSATVAQTSVILGTAQYFSPEQAKGETVDLRSDLYSTGVVLFEMLTGRAPFRGDSPIAVAYQHVSERPEVPSRLNPALTEPMDAVVLRALEKDKARRYQSAEEFRDDVDAVLAGRTPTARLPTVEVRQELFGGAEASPEATTRQLAFDDPGPSGTSSRPLRLRSQPLAVSSRTWWYTCPLVPISSRAVRPRTVSTPRSTSCAIRNRTGWPSAANRGAADSHSSSRSSPAPAPSCQRASAPPGVLTLPTTMTAPGSATRSSSPSNAQNTSGSSAP